MIPLKLIGIVGLAAFLAGGSLVWYLRGREVQGLEDSLAAAHERLDGWAKGHADLARTNARMGVQIDSLVTDRKDARAEAEQLKAAIDAQAQNHRREIARILERGRDHEADPAAIALDGLDALERLRAKAPAAAAPAD